MSKILKQALRKEFIARRKKQFLDNKDEYLENSLKAQNLIIEHPLFQKARSVALYMPIQGEVATDSICAQAWALNKNVYLPRCLPHSHGQMDFVACKSMHDLEPGAYGILEPKQELMAENSHTLKLDLCLVPGVAFDKKGCRLGFGAGYYDRFLEILQPQKTSLVGLAFSWQIVENLPTATWDIPMTMLVHQGGIQWI